MAAADKARPEQPDWRVSFWFLTDAMGWTGMHWAFVEAKDRDHAIAKCLAWAIKMGFHPDKDTKINATYEDGSGKL